MAQMAKGGGMGDMSALFGGQNPFGAQGGRPLAPPPGYYATTRAGGTATKSTKAKRDKRKAQKAARKKNKKRKK